MSRDVDLRCRDRRGDSDVEPKGSQRQMTSAGPAEHVYAKEGALEAGGSAVQLRV